MTRTTLRDELGLLETERDRIKAENESLKIRIAKQAGATEEDRALIRYLEARVEKLTEFNTTVKHLLRNILGTRETIVQQQAELANAERTAEPATPQADLPSFLHAPEQPDTLGSRIKRMMGGEEKAVANGQA